MKGITLAGLGTVIDLSVTGLAMPGYPGWLVGLMLALALLQLAGVGLAATGQKRLGGILVIVGGLFFIPIGMVACFGGRRLMDEEATEAFERQVVRRSPRRLSAGAVGS